MRVCRSVAVVAPLRATRVFPRAALAGAVLGLAWVCGCGCARVAARGDASPGVEATVSPATTRVTVDLPHALTDAAWDADLQAMIVPPVGWQVSVLPGSFNAVHQVWISPTGRTAYGVIRFSLPFPSPHDPVLWVFLNEMRRKEGQADLLEKRWDRQHRVLRAVIEGGRYRLRATIALRGLSGWMTYAGTLRAEPVEPEELRHAEAAREGTQYGKPGRPPGD